MMWEFINNCEHCWNRSKEQIEWELKITLYILLYWSVPIIHYIFLFVLFDIDKENNNDNNRSKYLYLSIFYSYIERKC